MAGNQLQGGGWGGGLAVDDVGSACTLLDCAVVGNGSPIGFPGGTQGGGIYVGFDTDVRIEGSVIADNIAGTDFNDAGGGVYSSGRLEVFNSTVVGNTSIACGGISSFYLFTDLTMHSTLIVGNVLVPSPNVFAGAGLCVAVGDFVNSCTVADNWTDDEQDDVGVGSALLQNSVLGVLGGTDAQITYSNIGGGYPGEGNLDVDPGFVGVVQAGSWSSDPTWNNALYQTIFHDDTQQWPPDEFKGLILAPSLAGTKRLCVIASNTETSITVWGDFREFNVPGAQYQVRDYRLRSDSQLINAGDPDFVAGAGEGDLDGHARVLCDRVDIGAYEFGIGDYDCDLDNDLTDFAAWQSCMTGPMDGPYADGCEAFDFVASESTVIDLTDFAGFQNHGLTIKQP